MKRLREHQFPIQVVTQTYLGKECELTKFTILNNQSKVILETTLSTHGHNPLEFLQSICLAIIEDTIDLHTPDKDAEERAAYHKKHGHPL